MLLSTLGSRLRQKRKSLELTQSDLAQKAGVSPRFLAQLEAGKGNISVQRLADVCSVLEISLSDLFRGMGSKGSLCLSLVGMRGAGKSTVGRHTSELLGLRFVELDELIVEKAQMPLSEIFSFGGEEFYHELNGRVLKQLFDRGESVVLATGGSMVMHGENWSFLRQSSKTVWLKASPDNHLARVISQGDLRPVRGRNNALQELKNILLQRQPQYAQAQFHLSTDQQTPEFLSSELVEFYKAL